jgi:predicted lipoprotein with Yx(FWY)xxD motif
MGTKAKEAARTGSLGGQVRQPRAKRSRRLMLIVAGLAGTALLVTACSSSGSSSSSPAASTPAASTPAASTPAASTSAASTSAGATAMLKTEKSSLGTVLANSAGLTVYWFAADHGDTSACTGACAAAWPPVTGVPQAAAGVTLSGTLGTITRAGGVKQATYNGHPLYTYAGDSSPGQVNGNMVNGFGAYWYAITIGSGTGASTAPSTGGGGAY